MFVEVWRFIDPAWLVEVGLDAILDPGPASSRSAARFDRPAFSDPRLGAFSDPRLGGFWRSWQQ